MGKLRVAAQSTASRISNKTAAQQPTTTIDKDSFALAGDLADAAAYNVSAPDPHATAAGLPDLAVPGEEIRGKPVYGLTGDSDPDRPGVNNVRSQLDSGTHLASADDGVITYGFFTHRHMVGINNNPGLGEGKGYTAFSEAQKAAARVAMQNWDDFIAPEFVEVNPGPGASSWAKNEADIWLANTFTGPAQAWAYYPGSGQPFSRVSSDVWIADPRANTSNAQLDPGFYGLQTLNHELGHAIGLSHPGDYNFGDDQDGDGVPDPITYEGDAFYAQDSHQYTIMSYFDTYELGNNQVDWTFMRFVYPSTPMVHDIWVAQQMYGVETSTRTGDTTYGFNATIDVTNAAMRFEEGEMATIFTIWDAGGNDTLDLSGYHSDSVIDLREGAYSSAGGWNAYGDAPVADPSTMLKADYLAYVNGYNQGEGFPNRAAGTYDLYFGEGVEGVNEGITWSEIMGQDWLMENNIGIAYGAIVENAVGGFGDDRINGNQVDNSLTGGAGADVFVFADDGSEDTVEDFETGVDKIDLTEFDAVAADVSWNAATNTISIAGSDTTIVVLGTDFNAATDLII